MKVKNLQASNVTASSSARTAASKHSPRCFWGMVSEPVPRVHTEGTGLCHCMADKPSLCEVLQVTFLCSLPKRIHSFSVEADWNLFLGCVMLLPRRGISACGYCGRPPCPQLREAGWG